MPTCSLTEKRRLPLNILLCNSSRCRLCRGTLPETTTWSQGSWLLSLPFLRIVSWTNVSHTHHPALRPCHLLPLLPEPPTHLLYLSPPRMGLLMLIHSHSNPSVSCRFSVTCAIWHTHLKSKPSSRLLPLIFTNSLPPVGFSCVLTPTREQ
jgi:hypothetical protein